MTIPSDIFAIEQLILWLKDNVSTGSAIHFDNEGKVDSVIALAALTRLLPQQLDSSVESYLTIAINTKHLSQFDKIVFVREWQTPYSLVAVRKSGYFLKLWETVDSAIESDDFYQKLSSKAKCIIAEAIKHGAQCIEFDCDVKDSFMFNT